MKIVYFGQDGVHMVQILAHSDKSFELSVAYEHLCHCCQCSDGLRAAGPGFDSRQRENFSVLHSIQTDSVSDQASYPMSTEGSFPGIKAAIT
jgi:hypothetical protein